MLDIKHEIFQLPAYYAYYVFKTYQSKHYHIRDLSDISFHPSLYHVTYPHKAQKAYTLSYQLSGLILLIINLIQYIANTTRTCFILKYQYKFT